VTDFQAHYRLVGSLFGTIKLMQMYGAAHDASQRALRNLHDAVRGLTGAGEEATVGVRGSRLQVNGHPMRAAECGNLALAFLCSEWNRRGIQCVRFLPTVDPAEVAAFATAFLEVDLTRPKPADRFIAAVAVAGVTGIVLERREDVEEEPVVLEERRESAMRAYLRGLRAFKEVLRFEGFRDRAKVLRARRAVQALVDRFLEDESAVLALAQIRGYDVKLFHHSLNVAIYALALGQGIGMSRRQLGALGLAALFHDLGKTVAPPGGAQSPDAIPRHPERGALLILEGGTAQEGMLKAAIAAYEHHARHDRTGFPPIGHDLHVVSRIVAIADSYEALTSSRDYRDAPYTSHDALAHLRTKAGTHFDPLLLKVFTRALGTYPVGSMVELDSGELAVVTERPGDAGDVDRPQVRVVRPEKGTLEPETVVDLADCDHAGVHLRAVARSLPAHEVLERVGEMVAAI
jgi:HD-GYP domain-containing protein (c-di-GMP phosphodiesterase class II)